MELMARCGHGNTRTEPEARIGRTVRRHGHIRNQEDFVTQLRTRLSTSDATSVTFRGMDLVADLLGKHSYTEVVYLMLIGRLPSPGQTRILDACLVTLIDHGMTPHSIVTRMVGFCNPQDAQPGHRRGPAVRRRRISGTMDGCAVILSKGVRAGGDPDVYCRRTVEEHYEARIPLPGFGHPVHKPDDPRTPKLFSIAMANGVEGRYIDLLKRLGREADPRSMENISQSTPRARSRLFCLKSACQRAAAEA